MLNKVLFCLLMALAVAIFIYEPPKPLIEPRPIPVVIPTSPSYPAIDRLNNQNQQIKSFVCDKIKVSVADYPLIQLRGGVAYEKDRHFRLTIYSNFGKEADLGSNDIKFWFWSRQMKDKRLHYADYDHLYNTRLKTPFHPLWMMECLSLGTVDTANATIESSGQFLIVKKRVVAVTGFPVNKVTVVDTTKPAIIAQYVYKDGKLVASCEITSHIEVDGYFVPKVMTIKWDEENVAMAWELENPIVNAAPNPELWIMPKARRSLDMGIE